MSFDKQLQNHAQQSEKVPAALAKALQTRNLNALEKLRSIAAMSLPAERKQQINGLIGTAQTYSVFLEELMGIEQGESIEKAGGMLDLIKSHCSLFDQAFRQLTSATKH